ncbi:MAG TPA: prenyltransferase/squalene oxidase repeat-containing protein [Pirellulaceae bacterium]|jgi:hypothetical protein|nr:prenyltransferase/squalene oxidase repeat-containing protein [Pirellulaceae bacterium]
MSDSSPRPRSSPGASASGNGRSVRNGNGSYGSHASTTAGPPKISLESNSPLPPLSTEPIALTVAPDPEAVAWESLDSGRPAPRRRPAVRLDGGALLCGCPDCGSPMSVRLWLMRADCWRCGTAIEITEEMLDEAERASRRKPKGARPAAAVAPAALAPVETPARRFADREPPAPEPAVEVARATPSPSPTPPLPPAPAEAPEAEVRVVRRRRTAAEARAEQALRRKSAVATAVDGFFKSVPAWIFSAIVHFVALTILALLTIPEEEPEPDVILLSAAVSADPREGGDVSVTPDDRATFDLPIPETVDLSDEVQRETLVRADQDARELRLDPQAKDPTLRPVEEVRRQVANAEGPRDTYLLRDPRLRAELVTQEGGTTLTEAAVARALRWLAEQQRPDGSWSLQDVKDGGSQRSDSAATSLALLPFLGAGQTHTTGMHRDTVSRGLRRLIRMQKEDGDLRANSVGQSGMYAHGQGAIVLCEAYAMTRDEVFREPAQKAIDFIVAAQHEAGGWRYAPNQPGDTSVVGWQLMALQSARSAGLSVPAETLKKSQSYLNSALDPQLSAKSKPLLAELSKILEEVGELEVDQEKPLSKSHAKHLRNMIEATELLGGEPALVFRSRLEAAAQSLEIDRPRPEDRTAAVGALDEAVQALYALQRGLDTGFYAYQPGSSATPVMTAEALLCRIYLGWGRDEPGLETGLGYCERNYPPDKSAPDVYYWYYATQSMHHLGGPTWERWNVKMRDVLVETQEKGGSEAGSWAPRGPHASAGGRLYMTALAACTLEVYYRHLPIYKQIELEQTAGR